MSFQVKGRHVIRSAAIGGAAVGMIGFLGGFVGPMIFMPEANQGPMLGIFITGPLGLVAGVIGGILFGLFTTPPQPAAPPPLPMRR